MRNSVPYLPQAQDLSDFDGQFIHKAVMADLALLRASAREAGFDLCPISAYRSVEQQLAIWNAKAAGQRPILMDSGDIFDGASADEEALMYAILRYSALPGASRHHWGCDFDVIDAAAMFGGYKVQLTLDETRGKGIFAAMHCWLDVELQKPETLFFRPYGPSPRGARCVAEEPWHLSYAPVAKTCQQALSKAVLEGVINGLDIELKNCILDNLQTIFDNYCHVNYL